MSIQETTLTTSKSDLPQGWNPLQSNEEIDLRELIPQAPSGGGAGYPARRHAGGGHRASEPCASHARAGIIGLRKERASP